MKKLLLILLCLPFIGFGQSFIKTFGDNNLLLDYGHSVQQTTDGGYIVTGYTHEDGAFGVSNVFLIKTDGSGIEQWNKIFGENTNNTAYSVQQTADGGYIIAGSTGNGVNDDGSDVYLIKTDGNGDSLWTKTFNSSNLSDSITVSNVAYSVQQTTDGGYIITGLCNPDDQSGETYFSFLLKVDGNGVEQWNQKLSDTYIAKSVKQTTDGGYIIAVSNGVHSWLTGYCDEGILIKTDAQGNEQWKKTFPQDLERILFYSVDQTADGGYIISGETDSIINGIQMDNWLIKTDAQGNEQWSQLFEGNGGKDAHQTTDGGYIFLVGSNWISQSQSDIKIIKTNGFGAEQWSKTFGTTQGDKGDVGLSVQQTTDGGYIITGYFDIVIPQLDYVMCLIKTDDNGNVTSTFNIPINPNRKLQKTVDILGKETKPKTNIPFIEIYDDGTVEKRIVIE